MQNLGTKNWQHGSTVERRYMELLEGRHVLVNCSERLPSQPPPWFDPVKFQRGQTFFRAHFSGIFLSKLCSLLLLLLSPQILKPLIFSGKSNSPWKAFRRYVSTIVHVHSWYSGNVWEEGNPARKSVQLVKSFHSRAALSMNSIQVQPLVDAVGIEQCGRRLTLQGRSPLRDAIRQDIRQAGQSCPYLGALPDGTGKDSSLYVNQYDMAMTQFAFFGMALLFPAKFGAWRASTQDLEGLIHFWRCIGYLLGIEDRFNFCAEDDLTFTRDLSMLTLRKFTLAGLKNFSEESEHMTTAIAKGLGYFLPGFSFESLFLYTFWTLGIEVPNFTTRVSLGSWIHFSFLRLVNVYLVKLPGVAEFFNFLLKGSVTLVVAPPSWLLDCFKPAQIAGLSQYWNV